MHYESDGAFLHVSQGLSQVWSGLGICCFSTNLNVEPSTAIFSIFRVRSWIRTHWMVTNGSRTALTRRPSSI